MKKEQINAVEFYQEYRRVRGVLTKFLQGQEVEHKIFPRLRERFGGSPVSHWEREEMILGEDGKPLEVRVWTEGVYSEDLDKADIGVISRQEDGSLNVLRILPSVIWTELSLRVGVGKKWTEMLEKIKQVTVPLKQWMEIDTLTS